MRDFILKWYIYSSVLVLMCLCCYSYTASAKDAPYRIDWYHSSSKTDLHAVTALPFQPFRGSNDLPAMANRGPYWFRIKLNDPDLKRGAALFIENEHLDTISLYQLAGGKLILIGQKGNDFPLSSNRVGCPDFDLPAGAAEYYLRTTFNKEISFPVNIRTVTGMDRWGASIFFQLGLYYGVCAMFLILNICLFIYLKDRLYLYYGLFMVFIVCSIIYADGLFTFLTASRWLRNNGDMIFHFGLALSGAQFARRFLNLKLSTAMKGLIAVLLVIALAGYIFSSVFNNYALFLTAEIAVVALLCYFWIMALGDFKKHLHARFFVFGYGLFLLFMIDFFVLRKFGIFVLELYRGQLKTGSLIEMVVLTIAVMFRIRALNEQVERYRLEIDKQVQKLQTLDQLAERQTDDVFERIQNRYGLSERELEVLKGINDGLTNVQIGERLFLSVHTVKFHTRNIFEKLNITNRTQALGKLHDTGQADLV